MLMLDKKHYILVRLIAMIAFVVIIDGFVIQAKRKLDNK